MYIYNGFERNKQTGWMEAFHVLLMRWGGGGLHINDGFGVAAFIVLEMLIYLCVLLNEMIRPCEFSPLSL